MADLAERQHGLVTAPQLYALGLSKDAILVRVRGARLHPVHRGVYAVGHRSLHPLAPLHAAVLAIGAGAVASHGSAAGLWGLLVGVPSASAAVDVAVTRQVRARRGVRVHRIQTLGRRDVTRNRGIPVTSPALTLLHLAEVAPERTLRRAVREAEVQALIRPGDLEARIAASSGRRGGPRLRRLLDLGPAPTRSELEDRTLAFLHDHGFPRPGINAAVRAGGKTFEADFLFAEQRVIVEADGARYHDTPRARAQDAERQAALEAAGYRLLRVTWRQVTDAPDQTVARLRRALAAGAAPPPRG